MASEEEVKAAAQAKVAQEKFDAMLKAYAEGTPNYGQVRLMRDTLVETLGQPPYSCELLECLFRHGMQAVDGKARTEQEQGNAARAVAMLVSDFVRNWDKAEEKIARTGSGNG